MHVPNLIIPDEESLLFWNIRITQWIKLKPEWTPLLHEKDYLSYSSIKDIKKQPKIPTIILRPYDYILGNYTASKYFTGQWLLLWIVEISDDCKLSVLSIWTFLFFSILCHSHANKECYYRIHYQQESLLLSVMCKNLRETKISANIHQRCLSRIDA